MITATHFDQAILRLKELDELTDYPLGSEEWWAVFASEVSSEARDLENAVEECLRTALDRIPMTRGLLVGLLAALYARQETHA